MHDRLACRISFPCLIIHSIAPLTILQDVSYLSGTQFNELNLLNSFTCVHVLEHNCQLSHSSTQKSLILSMFIVPVKRCRNQLLCHVWQLTRHRAHKWQLLRFGVHYCIRGTYILVVCVCMYILHCVLCLFTALPPVCNALSRYSCTINIVCTA